MAEIYKDGVDQWCDSIDSGMKYLKKLISDCEKLEDTFQSIDILAKKMYFLIFMTNYKTLTYCLDLILE